MRNKVSNLILTNRFWKKAREVQNIMDPLIRVLKIVDHTDESGDDGGDDDEVVKL